MTKLAIPAEIQYALDVEQSMFGISPFILTASLHDKSLTDPERWLWRTLLLMVYEQENWEIESSLSDIAKSLHRSIATVKRSLAPLAKKNWILLEKIQKDVYRIKVRMPREILNKAVEEMEEIKKGRHCHG